MLTETTVSAEGIYKHDASRAKRLLDIKKGAEYHQKLDSLAQESWQSNVPQFPAVTRQLSSLPKITTSVLSDQEMNMPRMLNMTSTPRQSFSMMSNAESGFSGTTISPYSQMSLPRNYSRISPARTEFVTPSPQENVNPNFNTWGSSLSPLDEQTRLTEDDLRPRELPFHYRDNKKIVVKPSPRKSVPMSRVAAADRDRHQRTVTNFRSRNGTIRIIKPLEPLPEIEKFQKSFVSDVFDIENIEREKTFMMLERIDRILHPNKKSPRTKLGSSEEEIISSGSSSMTIKDIMRTKEKSDLSLNLSPRKVSTSPHLSPRHDANNFRKGERSGRPGARQRQRVRIKDDLFKLRTPRTFSDVLHSLDVSQEDVDSKCQSWVDKYSDKHSSDFQE